MWVRFSWHFSFSEIKVDFIFSWERIKHLEMVFINHFINQYKSTWSWSFSATSSYFDEVAGHFNSPHLLLALLKNNISICVMQKLRILISMKVFFIPFDFVFSPFAGKLINTIYYSQFISFMSFVFLVGKFHFSFISFSPFFSRLYWQNSHLGEKLFEEHICSWPTKTWITTSFYRRKLADN